MIYKEIYRLKRVDESDFSAIRELFWKVFNKKVTLSYLRNKYNTSYLGLKYICSIAYCNDIPVAFYGAVPQKFENNNEEFFVAHACDSYTLPNHQRKGLHYVLAKYAYEIMKENNIKFVYAFHSENTYHSTKKLQWKEHRALQRFHINIQTFPLGKIFNRLRINFIYSIFFSKKVIAKSLEILRKEHPEKFMLQYNQEFINYKNSFNNHYFIEFEGCVFWFKIQAIIHVGMFYATSVEALKRGVKKLKRRAFLLGINEILFQVDTESKMCQQLKQITKPKESWLVGYLDFDPSINLEDFIFTYSDLDTF